MIQRTTFQNRGFFSNLDWMMIAIWLALVFAGWLNIYSSGNKDELINIFDFSQRYGKQILWIGLAMLLGIAILIIDPRAIPSFSYILYLIFIVLLVAVLFFGKEVNNSKSWFQIGGFALQPAEFVKVATALALSRYMSRLGFDIRNRKSSLVIAGIILLPTALIILQPDMGSAVVLLALVLMLYRFGLRKWYLFGALTVVLLFILDMLMSKLILSAVITVIAGLLIFYFRSRIREIIFIGIIALSAITLIFAFDYIYSKALKPHQKERIEVYMSNLQGVDRDIKSVGYNFYQSKVAIGSGGIIGKGYLKGTQTKMNFIPEQDTDFIFCTVGEEWGFAGSLLIISLYLILLIRIIKRAEMQRSEFSRIYGYAAASLLFFHFFVNVGMTIGLAPVIGIPLPFLSYGGSSLWAFTLLLFIFIKQDMHRFEVIG